MKLTPVCLEVLKAGGWYPGRDIFDELLLPKEKTLFPIAEKIISEFGLLEIVFEGHEPSEPIEKIAFDVDESRRSQIFRARAYNYEKPEDIDPKVEPDFIITEDYKLTALVSEKLGMQCCYLGFHEEYLGFDIFVAESGEIYATHYQEPIKSANSFEEFLNKIIKGKHNKSLHRVNL